MTTRSELLRNLSEEGQRLLAEETLLLDVSEDIRMAMEKRGVNYAELARRLDVSRSRVTQMLDDDSNLTLRVIARIAYVLDMVPKLQLQNRREEPRRIAWCLDRPREWSNAGNVDGDMPAAA